MPSITSQISYASTSAALSNRSVYPNLFRTVPSDEPLTPALATVMQYYGWRTLSILTEQQIQFTAVHMLHACIPQVPCAPSYTLCLKHLYHQIIRCVTIKSHPNQTHPPKYKLAEHLRLMDVSISLLQLLPQLQIVLSKAAISVEKSVKFTMGNLSEDSVSVFVSQSLIGQVLAVHDHSIFTTLIGWGISHLPAQYKSSISTLLSLQGEKIQKFKVHILCCEMHHNLLHC